MVAKTDKQKAASRRTSQSKARVGFTQRVRTGVKGFLSRRPHRSFRLTRRRDYARSLVLPGYWAFTSRVIGVMRGNGKALLTIAVLYAVMSLVFLGIGSQTSFTELRETVAEVGDQIAGGDWSAFGQASIIAVSTIAGAISPELTEAQQVYAVILGLLTWLVVVWLLRQRMAGAVVKVRDALYNAGAPIIPMTLLFFVLVIQLIPVALVAIAYTAAQASGLLGGGVEAMLFWVAAAGLAALSLYWITATSVALVIVTVPGVYPLRALRIAGDMVVGRRLRILYRILWMMVLTAIAWVAVLIPIVLIDMGVKHLWPVVEWLPLVPVAILLLGSASLVWVTTYVYVLYRGIVDDDAKPA